MLKFNWLFINSVDLFPRNEQLRKLSELQEKKKKRKKEKEKTKTTPPQRKPKEITQRLGNIGIVT